MFRTALLFFFILIIIIECCSGHPDNLFSLSLSPSSRHLLGNWVEHTDPNTGRKFYCDDATKQCSWTQQSSAALPECSEQHLRISYTRCHWNKRSLVYYFEPGTCFGGINLPPPIPDLSCDISCSPGERLKAGASECESCSPGTFAIGGGRRYSSWQSIPSDFRTSFLVRGIETSGGGWIAGGNEINSGGAEIDLSDAKLELGVELVRSGEVSFEYKVDAEKNFDGLGFFVDGQLAMFQSNVYVYTAFTTELEAGVHTLTWIYHKDFSMSDGADTAYIRKIEIRGTEFNDQDCTPCEPGYISAEKASECHPCPFGTFAAADGKSCVNCPDDKYALPGATTCVDKPVCTASDTMVTFSLCDGSVRTKHISYKQPKICKGDALPDGLQESSQVPCPPCDKGMFRNGTKCVYCPDGSYSSESSQCEVCPAGKMAKKVLYFDQSFSPEEAAIDFKTGCESGYCSAGGWRFMGDRIDSGQDNSLYASVWLELNVALSSAGTVTFNYSTTSGVNLELRIDSKRAVTIIEPTALDSKSAELSSGDHVLRWVSTMRPIHTGQQMQQMAQIFAIQITGVKEGGAIQCDDCPPGSISAPGSVSCHPCAPGTYQSGTDCVPCPTDSFSEFPGSHECIPCGQGTFAEAGSSVCIMQEECVYNPKPSLVMYNFSMLSSDSLEEIHETNRSFIYYLSLCRNDLVNQTCKEKNGEDMQAFICQLPLIPSSSASGSSSASSSGASAGTNTAGSSASAYNLGKRVAFSYDQEHPDDGFSITYYDGSNRGCANGESRKTTIKMICDGKIGRGYPKEPSSGKVEAAKCSYELEWRSSFACRQCNFDDYVEVLRECLAPGTQIVDYVKKTEAKCHGNQPDSSQRECKEVVVSQSSALIGISVALAVVVSLLGGVVFLYMRNRQIYKQYSLLKEQNEAEMELERYTLDEEES